MAKVAAGQKRHLFRDTVHFLFGFDFFISYSHSDGLNYPGRLADALRARGFKVFLDKREYVAGDDLRVATRARIRSARKLVLVARPHALRSEWVRKEVSECIDAGRIPVLVDVNETLAKAPADAPLKVLLGDRLYVSEALTDSDAAPSDHVLSELVRSFNATRTETLRLRVVSAAAMVFALVAAVAVWQWGVAREQESIAREQEILARHQEALAEERALDASFAAQDFQGLCKEAVKQVNAGYETLQSLKTSKFGELVATIAEELANLPQTKGVSCEARQRPPDWRPPKA